MSVCDRFKAWLWFHVDATQGGLRTRYVLADPPCVHRKGLTVRVHVAARAVIGPLTKTLAKNQKPVHDCVEASAWSLICVDVEP